MTCMSKTELPVGTWVLNLAQEDEQLLSGISLYSQVFVKTLGTFQETHTQVFWGKTSGCIWVRVGPLKKGEETEAHKTKNTALIPGTLYTPELTIYKLQRCFLGPKP